MEKKEAVGIEEKAYWHWFLGIPVSYVGQRKLLACYGTPKKVMEAPEEQVLQIIGKEKAGIEYLKTSKNTDWKKAYTNMEARGICLTLKGEEGYPAALQPLADAPYGLYHIGKLPGDELCVGIIGARSCSRYGQEMAAELAGMLAEAGIGIVSGMARGIDGAGQWAALEHGGKSYAVLGSGVDVCYPMENERLYRRLKSGGAVISEFPPGTEPLPWHFPVRNRIISGLSRVLAVVEARRRSGSLITADFALEQGRDIYAVPGRITDELSSGCNELIRNGAGILTSPEMLLGELGVSCCKKEKSSKKSVIRLAKKENMLYSCLDLKPKSAEIIRSETGLSVTEIMEMLVSLQLKGLVREEGTGCYALAGRNVLTIRGDVEYGKESGNCGIAGKGEND